MCVVVLYNYQYFFTLFSSFQVLKVVLSVCENTASSREDWPRLRLFQSQDNTGDACVWTRWEELRHLYPFGQRTLQVLYHVFNGYTNISSVAHHQSMNWDTLKAVTGKPIRNCNNSVLWRFCTHFLSWPAMNIQHVHEKNFEEFFKTCFYLENKQKEKSYKKNCFEIIKYVKINVILQDPGHEKD